MRSKPRADHVGETRTAYLKNARRVIMAGEVCGICGRPVDKSLKYPDPMAPSVIRKRVKFTAGFRSNDLLSRPSPAAGIRAISTTSS